MCQFRSIPEMAEPASPYENAVEYIRKTLSKMKKKLRYFQSQMGRNRATSPEREAEVSINPGDLVRIRPLEEIQNMLDYRGTFRGCPFIESMAAHCNKTYRVLKNATYFYDELKGKLCKCKDLVVLENTICQGKQKLYSTRCDLLCLFFWHKRWLTKVSP